MGETFVAPRIYFLPNPILDKLESGFSTSAHHGGKTEIFIGPKNLLHPQYIPAAKDIIYL
jgi:hypothetical protein